MLAPLCLAWLQAAAAPGAALSFRAALATPGGELAFGLELQPLETGAWTAFLVNGEERIEVPRVAYDGRELVLELPHYDSRIRARRVTEPAEASGTRFEGEWEKRRGQGSARLPFAAVPAVRGLVFPPDPAAAELAGRWAADFATDEAAAVLVLAATPAHALRGTFLTATGDYRYLAGRATSAAFELACFDGAHAFLFRATRRADGTLAGDFWSGDWHHETWTAKRDDSAALADPFAQTRWNGTTKLSDLRFPDLDGEPRALSEFAGKATLLVVFGSWCPNCNDEAKLLAELDAKYRARGLAILGLAFELSGDSARDAAQVRIFAERHGLRVPFFLCGTADKDEATKALGLVDRVRAFPTTIFVGADGLPRAIHSGFAGPATGEEHVKLRREFETRIEALLGGKR